MISVLFNLTLVVSSLFVFMLGSLFYAKTLTPKQWISLKPNCVSNVQWQAVRQQIAFSPLLALNDGVTEDIDTSDPQTQLLIKRAAEASKGKVEANLSSIEEQSKGQVEAQESPEEAQEIFTTKSLNEQDIIGLLKQDEGLTEVTGDYGLNLRLKNPADKHLNASLPDLEKSLNSFTETEALKELKNKKLEAYQQTIITSLNKTNNALKSIKH